MTTPVYVPDQFPGVQGISLATRLLPNLAQKPATANDGISKIAVSWASGVKGVPPINEQVNVPDTLYLPCNLEVAGNLVVDGTLTVTGSINGIAPSARYKPANPAVTSSTTGVMMGLGAAGGGQALTYTPTGTGIVLVSLSCVVVMASGATGAITVGGRYGTGTAPSNGAAVQGTVFGPATDPNVRANVVSATAGAPLTTTDRLALTANTAYWFDCAVFAPVNTDTCGVISVTAVIAEVLA